MAGTAEKEERTVYVFGAESRLFTALKPVLDKLYHANVVVIACVPLLVLVLLGAVLFHLRHLHHVEEPHLPRDFHGIPSPPNDVVQFEQVVNLEEQLQRVDLMGGISEDQAKRAYENLYGNWTLNDISKRYRYLPGMRVQILGGREIFFQPEPPEFREVSKTDPNLFSLWFELPAAHILSFLTKTAETFPLPDVDFTVSHHDLCFDITRSVHESWGLGSDPQANAPEYSPPEESESLQAPVFSWNTAVGGRKTCNVMTMPTYDWSWYQSSFVDGSLWRLNSSDPPSWSHRMPKIVWRGNLIGEDGIRSRALRLGLLHPDFLDIKVTGGMNCSKYVSQVSRFNRKDKQRDLKQDCQDVQGDFMQLTEQRKYRYILEVDGASSTFRFKNELLGGFLIFKVDSPNRQYFFGSLKPYVHYIPVDSQDFEGDLLRKLQWADDHPRDSEAIVAQAVEFAKRYLTDDAAHWQQQAALGLYASKQAFRVSRSDGMQRFCCQDLTGIHDGSSNPVFPVTGIHQMCASSLDEHCVGRAPRSPLFELPNRNWRLAEPVLAEHYDRVMEGLSEVLRPFTLEEGFVAQIDGEVEKYYEEASQSWIRTICETGFNAGHSAVMLLMFNPNATLYSFDIGRYPYTIPAIKYVQARFKNRFFITLGDSTQSIPKFQEENPHVRCDLAIVDGGHLLNVPKADIKNFQRMTNPKRNIVIVDDTPCDAFYCQGPTQAWKEAVAQGTLRPLTTVTLQSGGVGRGYSVGEYRSQLSNASSEHHIGMEDLGAPPNLLAHNLVKLPVSKDDAQGPWDVEEDQADQKPIQTTDAAASPSSFVPISASVSARRIVRHSAMTQKAPLRQMTTGQKEVAWHAGVNSASLLRQEHRVQH